MIKSSKSSGFAKTTLQGTLKVTKTTGRQRKKLGDNIKDRRQMGSAKSAREAENRTGAKSSLVSQRISRLEYRTENFLHIFFFFFFLHKRLAGDHLYEKWLFTWL